MGSNISANTLFHFTSSRDKLSSILENGFYPRCCMESVEFFYEKKYHDGLAPTEIAIPMVCFCDIPLSQIENHVKKYGGYAIGMNKNWGKKNGINPVMYEIPNSNPLCLIRASLDKTIKYYLGQYYNGTEGKLLAEIGSELISFLCYLKPYEGRNWNRESSSFDNKKIKFYDEREWRYIPSLKILHKMGVEPFLPKNKYLNEESRQKYDNSILSEKLEFNPDDIRYIIVECEDEVLAMAQDVDRIKAQFCDDERKLLSTKILSIDRLRDDF